MGLIKVPPNDLFIIDQNTSPFMSAVFLSLQGNTSAAVFALHLCYTHTPSYALEPVTKM